MVIDASAVMAVLLEESDGEFYLDRIIAAPLRIMAPINALEAHMLMRSRKREPGVRRMDEFLATMSIAITPTDAAQLAAARAAFDRYGKGRHPAGLNIADCFAYALARTSGEPLLFKGGDFALTDVLVA